MPPTSSRALWALVGALLVVGGFFLLQEVLALRAQAQAGALAYQWLASPSAPGSKDMRAKVLEEFLAAQKGQP